MKKCTQIKKEIAFYVVNIIPYYALIIVTKQEISTAILSEITVYLKYAKYQPEHQRRETWEELVSRNMLMHIKKYPQLTNEIIENYKFVFDKKVLPSMRSLQFGG